MIPPARSFVFLPAHDQAPDPLNPRGGDAHGAFSLGESKYRDLYGPPGGSVTTFRFDNLGVLHHQSRRRTIFDAMERGGGNYDALVYFGHGFPGGLAHTGIDNDCVAQFAAQVRRHCTPSVKIILYACWAGEPGQFAYRVGQALAGWAQSGMAVFAHRQARHSYRNPLVYRFPSHHGAGGEPVHPIDDAWRHAMAHERNLIWAKFPFMTPEEIKQAIV
ncbi:hypothetical protein [Plastoroseomonas arctica]|uniref:DUF4347 domain-containing protein n=1 Tax=Plastoroseomonas arctica TaxID=1509237 RepID=A0AAF1KKZ0_9PROT|nr:hypothetical protein [Plastoroseomonas arctica]MBR0657150.1 hypothetical protein [Plastoroseomonas arctica]